MAELKPLHALRYDPAVAGPLQDLVAPPYDVIDADQRAALVAQSPFNAVEIDLPEGEDRYRKAAALLETWRLDGVVAQDAEPALFALTQDYTGPDGAQRTRQGFFARVRVTDYGPGRIRPHERTHPGPKEDRLRLTRATRANLSPIFSLYSDPDRLAWAGLAAHTTGPPDGEVTDDGGTVHRLWRVADPQAIATAIQALADTELLIADGHHRYETARAYAEEIGGEGPHRYVLMCLVALEDPGLTIFPTHRLAKNLDSARQEKLAAAIRRDFDVVPVDRDEIAPPPGDGPLTLGYIDRHFRAAHRLTLKDQQIADIVLADMPPAYRTLDAGVLETLLLKGALDLTDDDISHLHDFGYARDTAQALHLVDTAAYDVAFILRPTPVQQVRDIAASGQSMPPKSTYFFPKVLTGLLFNPLE
ncbi:MAG: DUF1015 domain-containing protein [Actinobacteria bacterium]|nr:DUF1015 domain-containing protein [Actinomycetota bacterium]